MACPPTGTFSPGKRESNWKCHSRGNKRLKVLTPTPAPSIGRPKRATGREKDWI